MNDNWRAYRRRLPPRSKSRNQESLWRNDNRGTRYGNHGKCAYYSICRAEHSRPRSAHNDALVITASLANYEVERIFIDSRSFADIPFGNAFDQMQLGDTPLEEVNTSLYGFMGEVVHHRGLISLLLMLVTCPAQRTCVLKFLVVDVPSAYNVIFDRPTLNIFQAVISMYHIKIKFPTLGGVGEVKGDPLQFQRCYVEAVRKGQKRSPNEAVEETLIGREAERATPRKT
ncbi:UNVERIFIED_CONTAM: hypothetical protein Sradi_4042700 [Sesamum radiatum]|uniref:Uncharacterized protein n=1 Tax=Sesamum radiatum TaxID=300843 RepID=A0AAW2PLL0_SESRA